MEAGQVELGGKPQMPQQYDRANFYKRLSIMDLRPLWISFVNILFDLLWSGGLIDSGVPLWLRRLAFVVRGNYLRKLLVHYNI